MPRELSTLLDLQRGDMVSLIGSGGKTTIMYQLGRELARQGGMVILATTTQIYPPAKDESDLLLLQPAHHSKGLSPELIQKVTAVLEKEGKVTVGSSLQENGKVRGVTPEWLQELRQALPSAFFLVEADGSRGKPLKGHLHHEPPLPPPTTYYLAVVGAMALGKPLEETWVHRPEVICQRFRKEPGERVTPELMIQVLVHPEGYFRGSEPCIRSGGKRGLLINQVERKEEIPEILKICQGVREFLPLDGIYLRGNLWMGETLPWKEIG